jgi:EAL and modified HD-GYP domain-containing signal transduction protein
LLAEKVETHATFERCRELGFDLFQGYFFAQPQLVRSQRMPADRVALMRLLTRVQDPAADIEEIEQLVASNVTLSYKLLRYVNSALLGVSMHIESIHHAIVMLGLERVRTCASMLLLAGVEDKPHELIVTALVRARYCQLLAMLRPRESAHQYFTVGLLSVLDAFMDRPMQELLGELHIAPELEAALLRRQGPLGEVLDAAIACERADWPRLMSAGFEMDALRAAYVQALAWVAETDSAIGAATS